MKHYISNMSLLDKILPLIVFKSLLAYYIVCDGIRELMEFYLYIVKEYKIPYIL